jgi:drug/metabolite transporter (DMT)-like permease
MFHWICVLMCVAFTVGGQLILKWRVNTHRTLRTFDSAWELVASLFTDYWTYVGFSSSFVASIFWMAALTRLPLTLAYPFMSLSFLAVMLVSAWMLGESLSGVQIVGAVLLAVSLWMIVK